MRRLVPACALCALCVAASGAAELRLPVDEYRAKMRAGWIGQMAGVVVGAPTEFKFNGPIMPRSKVARLACNALVMPGVVFKP